MKKSKLLQNSKDLISRSFNPSKCKTSLRLAGSRMKLLRNKKEAQVKQAKREIAQLLESGQDQTARIRVEHVIREEKMMDAYDLLQIYCELVVARLPIIESQKNCPVDLKEAIASLVFAAPRCGDVPELIDVRKQITAKYGKEFTSAAIELRPQCGVGPMLIGKLSAVAPDGQTKLKILSAIAEGHNVKWDPKSFGDKDYVPENDMGGPSSFTKENEQYAKPPHFEAAQVQGRSNYDNMTMHTLPPNVSQQDDTTSVAPEKLIFAQTPGLNTPLQSEAKPAALRNERRREETYTSSSIDSPLDRNRWNMEFKDATSAAQAAAESAERASIAARAAAEHAAYGRISRQYSTEHSSDGRSSSQRSTEESHKSNVDILKDEGPEVHPNSKSQSEHTRFKNEKIEGVKRNPKMSKSFKEEGAGSSHGYYSQSASLQSKVLVNDDDSMSDHGTISVDEYYSQKDYLKDASNNKMRAEKQSIWYETESANNSWPEKAENLKERRIGREHSIKSSFSQSTSEDVNIFSNSEYQKIKNDAGEDPFVRIDKIGSINGDALRASSHASAAIFIDKNDSDIDDDHSLFDKGPTYDEQEFHLSSSFGRKSPKRHTDSWSPRSSDSSKIVNSTSSLFFTRKKSPSPDLSKNTTLRDDSELNSAPLMFDESDRSISDSDDEEMNTRQTTVYDSKDPLHYENSVFDSQNLPFSSDDELGSSLKMPSKRNQVNIFDYESSSDDNRGRLNFGKLTGGFRHKGHNHLPFPKNRLDESSSSVKKEFEETTATINTPTNVDGRPERRTVMLYHKKNPTQEDMHSESDSDISEEEVYLTKNSSFKQPLTPVKEVKTKPDSFFGTDNSDLDEDSSKKDSLTRKYHVQRSGISQRTKASPSASKAESHMKARLRSEEELDDSDAGDIARKPTPSSNSGTPKKTESHRKNSGKWETYEKPTSMPSKSSLRVSPENPGPAKTTSVMKHNSEARDSDASLGKKPASSHARQELESRRNSGRLGNLEKPNPVKSTSKPINSTLSGKATPTSMPESKISQKSSIVEDPKAKASIGSDHTSNKDENAKKEPSHVHPKLPDYDTLFQSLRKNRS